MFWKELKEISRNRMLRISLAAIMLIPLLYSGIFLWAFWDPYGHLDQLPVAVVNRDKGAEFEGENLHIGDELQSELEKSDDFDFHIVTKKEAKDGLKQQEYYMMIEIPPDFSKNATTLMDEKPEKLELIYTPNESYNFVSSQIGQSAVKEIRASVQKDVTKTYAKSMFDQVKKMGDGYTEAQKGAGELDEGALKITKGTDELKKNLEALADSSISFSSGIDKANEGSKQVASGASSLSNGLGQLSDGQKQLANGGQDLQEGINQIAAGSASLKDGLASANANMPELIDGTAAAKSGVDGFREQVPALADGTASLASGADELNAGIDEFETKLKSQISAAQKAQMDELLPMLAQVMTEEQVAAMQQKMAAQQDELNKGISTGFDQLQTGSSQVAAGARELNETISNTMPGKLDELSAGLGEIQKGQQQLQTGLGNLQSGAGKVTEGAQSLQSGSETLVTGLSTLAEKTTEAKSGADTLARGASDLSSGLLELAGGSHQLSEGAGKLASGSADLAKGSAELEQGTKKLQTELSEAADKAGDVKADDDTYTMMAEPVQVAKETFHKVPNYGTGMAPYMLSLGLFVGAIMLTIVFPLKETPEQPKSGFSWFRGKLGIFLLIGTLQASAASIFLLNVLDLHVQSVPRFVLLSFIVSAAFMTLIQMLATILGNPGRFIAVLILISQLTASGGTFPLELIPKTLQHLTGFLPMAYSINAFRAVISSGDYAFMWQNAAVLAGFALFNMTVTALFFRGQFKKQYGRLTAA
ncbi:YhgE/Pip domain-containing protein [Domibacillus robiginosus]|uniref:YhgE/Pip domain-containing protein n=1 Tax=Domibacillus robiginosus TaxID=1071054 RepID=UPI00067B0F30|nr:YhgE/Pip domain-containing protein [Domibacillus robiginosus]